MNKQTTSEKKETSRSKKGDNKRNRISASPKKEISDENTKDIKSIS